MQLKLRSDMLSKQSCGYVMYHVTICRICIFMQMNIMLNYRDFSMEFWYFTSYSSRTAEIGHIQTSVQQTPPLFQAGI